MTRTLEALRELNPEHWRGPGEDCHKSLQELARTPDKALFLINEIGDHMLEFRKASRDDLFFQSFMTVIAILRGYPNSLNALRGLTMLQIRVSAFQRQCPEELKSELQRSFHHYNGLLIHGILEKVKTRAALLEFLRILDSPAREQALILSLHGQSFSADCPHCGTEISYTTHPEHGPTIQHFRDPHDPHPHI